MATLTQTKEKKIVLKAIDELGRRVTPADISAKTGLPVLAASAELNRIASETGGHLEVANTGDIAYKFDPGYLSTYLTSGFRKTLSDIWDKVFKAGFFLVRISFGVMLIVSLIVIALLVVAVILYYSRGGDRDRDFGGFGGGHHGFRFGFFDYLILRELLWWGTYSRTPTYYRYDRPTIRKPETKGNFLFNCFSFLFGDGNPNLNLEERKWQMIAEVIRKSKGVVTAEQLAPYTGEDPKNEDGVLPVLVRFDGRPEVTDEGDIVYVFPSLQVTTSGLSMINLEPYLKEWEWKFSNVSTGELVPVYILAGVNFVGSWFLLFQMFAGVPILLELSPLIWLLTIYGTLFLAVPLVRHLVNIRINASIEARNRKRQANSRLLGEPSDALLKKLARAGEFKSDAKVLTAGDTIYTSEKDSLEQEFDD